MRKKSLSRGRKEMVVCLVIGVMNPDHQGNHQARGSSIEVFQLLDDLFLSA